MPFPDDVPVLTDGDVTLRPYRLEDAPHLIEFATDERSRTFVPLPHPYGPAEAEAYLGRANAGWAAEPVHPAWAIEVEGRFAGGINLHPRAPRVWEVGFSVQPAARGRGIATAAVRLAVDHAFESLQAATVTWRCGAGNFASWRAAWANGFSFNGVWPDMHPGSFGAVDDQWQGSLRRAAWQESRQREHRPVRPWWEAKTLRGPTGGTVMLRAFRDDDVLPVGPDDVAQRFNADAQPQPQDFPGWLRERRRRMAEGGGVYWCIADAQTDELLGHVSLQRLDVEFSSGTGWLGYWLLPAARGKGAIAQTLEMLIPHAFAPLTDQAGVSGGLGLHRLYAGTDEDHRASQRALRRAGFRECATERSILAHRDRPASGAISFELLASDDRDAQRVEPLTVPELRTERLLLREWTENDAPTPEQVSDAQARRFMAGDLPTSQTFTSRLRARRLAADRGEAVNWCVTDAQSGQVLGNIGLFGIGQGIATGAEVGYWLWQQARGRGVTAEALAAVLEHGFGTVGLTRVHAETDLANIASQRILLAAGFTQWGTDHQAYTNADGSITDGAYFELLAHQRATRS